MSLRLTHAEGNFVAQNWPTRHAKPLISLIYLGRSPAFGCFVSEMAAAACDNTGFEAEFIVADHTELADRLRDMGVRVFPITTFSRTSLLHVTAGYLSAKRRLLDRLATTRPAAALTLMPHIWSPLIAPQIKRLGIRYMTIIHDALPHPGDPTATVTSWLTRDAKHADVVLTLSRSVATELRSHARIPPGKMVQTFHPDLNSGVGRIKPRRRPEPPYRVLFFGRIMAYKGLDLLIDAIELLRAEGMPIQVGVAGTGEIGPVRGRLDALGAEIANRWLSPAEVGPLLDRYDAMACSHTEASQSGVAALAFGNGMPVVAMPVGGITEQVIDAKTGVLSANVSARAFADAINRLFVAPGVYEGVSRHLAATVDERSMDRFLSEIVAAALAGEQS